jgi:hypothetical protein
MSDDWGFGYGPLGNIKPVSALDDERRLAHDEFLCRPLPDDLVGEMGQIVHENFDLRQRLAMCQIEYEKTQELARSNYRNYADKCKEEGRLAYKLKEAEDKMEHWCSVAMNLREDVRKHCETIRALKAKKKKAKK